MILKICPYCDSVMTRKHRCEACNSFVWKAQELEGNSFKESTAESTVYENNQTQKYVQKNVKFSGNTKKKGSKKTVGIFWICIFLICLGSFLTSDAGEKFLRDTQQFFKGLFTDSSKDTSDDFSGDISDDEFEYYNFDTKNGKENYDSGVWQYETGGVLTEEECTKNGMECTGHPHFNVSRQAVISEISSYYKRVKKASDTDLSISTQEAQNWVMHDGDDEITYFEIWDFIDYEGSRYSVLINSDTVTQRLHELSTTVEEKDVKDIIRLFVRAACGSEPGEALLDQCMDFSENEYTFNEFNNCMIHVSVEESYYYVSVSGI